MAGSRLGNFLARALTPVILIVAVLVMFDRCSGANYTSTPAPTCPPIQPGAISLAPDHLSALADLEAKAQELNAAGLCVLEGSLGTGSGKYYLTVQRLGSSRPELRHFTRGELRPR